jgi:hypothetical protein
MHHAEDEKRHACHCKRDQRGILEGEISDTIPEHAFGREEPKGRQTEQTKQTDDQGRAVEWQPGEKTAER